MTEESRPFDGELGKVVSNVNAWKWRNRSIPMTWKKKGHLFKQLHLFFVSFLLHNWKGKQVRIVVATSTEQYTSEGEGSIHLGFRGPM